MFYLASQLLVITSYLFASLQNSLAWANKLSAFSTNIWQLTAMSNQKTSNLQVFWKCASASLNNHRAVLYLLSDIQVKPQLFESHSWEFLLLLGKQIHVHSQRACTFWWSEDNFNFFWLILTLQLLDTVSCISSFPLHSPQLCRYNHSAHSILSPHNIGAQHLYP